MSTGELPPQLAPQRALARCTIAMQPETAAKIAAHGFAKGDVIGVARIAAIQAAKRTSEIVPAVLGTLLGAIEVGFSVGEHEVAVEVQVLSRDGRGVEMEALSACAVAALTIYDMCKAIDRTMTIQQLALAESASLEQPNGNLSQH